MRSISRSLAVLLLVCLAAGAQQKVNLDTGIKGSRLPFFGTDSGTANTYVLTTIAPLGPSLRTGSTFLFFAGNSNTGASTLAVDGGSAISIVKSVSTALASGDISANGIVEVAYDGTNFQCMTCSSGGGSSFYQTVQANGTSQTQRGKLNLKSGTNTTVSCADNSGAGSTDCTVSASGSGISSGGPTFLGKICSFVGNASTVTSYGCSGFNLVANETIFIACLYYTGTNTSGTLGANDTASLTWTQVTGASAFDTTSFRGAALFWANSGSTTGSDTFHCTDSINVSFNDIVVVGFLGASANPVDASNAAHSSTLNNNFILSLTSTSANDGSLFFADYATSLTAQGYFVQMFSDSSNAGFMSYTPLGSATTFSNFMNFGGAYSAGAVLVH